LSARSEFWTRHPSVGTVSGEVRLANQQDGYPGIMANHDAMSAEAVAVSSRWMMVIASAVGLVGVIIGAVTLSGKLVVYSAILAAFCVCIAGLTLARARGVVSPRAATLIRVALHVAAILGLLAAAHALNS
jgi:hypothetical protein